MLHAQVSHYSDGSDFRVPYASIDGQTARAEYLLEAHALDNAK
jgi:hypothetical protein